MRVTHPPSIGLLLGFALLAFGVGAPTSAGAQGAPATIERGSASPGIPRHTGSCTLQSNDRPFLRCEILFDEPSSVIGSSVTARGDGGTWSSSFRPGDPAGQDSAFLFLFDRNIGGPQTNRRALNDLTALAGDIRRGQRGAVAAFGQEFEPVADFATDGNVLSGAAQTLQPRQGPSETMRHALTAIERLAAVDARRRILVLMSSGPPADTAFTADQVIAAANEAGVRIVGVGYAFRESDVPQLQALRRLAAETNGAFVMAPLTNRPLPDDVRTGLLANLTTFGILTADSPNAAMPDAVDVTLSFPEGRDSTFAVRLSPETPAAGAVSMGGGGDPVVFETGTWLDRIVAYTGSPWRAALAAFLALLAIAGAAWLLLSRREAAPAESDMPADAYPVDPRPDVDAAPPLPEERIAENVPPADERPAAAFLEPNGSAASRIPVYGQWATLGRSTDNDVVASENNVSRHHVRLSLNGEGGWELVNLTWNRPREKGGTNPVSVNGTVIADKHILRDGDQIVLGNVGNTMFVFREAGDEQPISKAS